MKELKNRYYIIIALIVFLGLVYIARLFSIQVLDSSYKSFAENNSRRVVTIYPTRGLIYSRDSLLLVGNKSSFDLMVVPKRVGQLDTAKFIKILSLDSAKFIKEFRKAKRKKYLPSMVYKEIPDSVIARFQEFQWLFPGFFLQSRTLRSYPQASAAHILGYIGEVNKNVVDNDDYYSQGDYIGVNGVEKTYEKFLRGQKGRKIYSVDAKNRVKGSYKKGKYDIKALAGKNLVLSINAKLQKYAEKLFGSKRGSLVAIEPATGEILSLVSSPGFDPNLLVGRKIGANYMKLLKSEDKILFNRAIMAQYPPGSTFKLVNALIGLQEGVITEHSVFNCFGGYNVGHFHMGCHHHGAINFMYSIQASCNTYYANVFDRILRYKHFSTIGGAYTEWRNFVLEFGLGKKLGTDLAQELRGYIPKSSHFDKYFGKDKWKPLNLISMAIGQGELGFSPLQMANMTASIANRGYYITPHIIHHIEEVDTITHKFKEKHRINIEKKYFDKVVDAMERVTWPGGTAPNAFVDGLYICGKTGTAENPHGKDHSVFVAFAPKDNPQIAISVYVENAGFGSTWAAPIASLMIEKYLRDSISRPWMEERIMKAKFNYKKQRRIVK